MKNDDFDEEGKKDKTYKISSLYPLVSQNSSKIRKPTKLIAIDESMIAYKGKTSEIHQYLPSKFTKWGFKLWMESDRTGYAYNTEIYQGAKYDENGKKIPT